MAIPKVGIMPHPGSILYNQLMHYDMETYKSPLIGSDLNDYNMRGNPNLRESLYRLNQNECIEKIVRLEHEVNRLHSELSNAHIATGVMIAMKENLTGQGVPARSPDAHKLLLLIPS